MALSIAYDPKEAATSPIIDIVAVHGLGGDSIGTWTHPKSKAFWLKDFLPLQIPDARVMTFGYNADAAFGQSTADVVDHAKSLLASLVDNREEPEEVNRPLIFIAHSLGGIVVKQALFQALLESRYKSIGDATLGLIFFGTPHRGSDKATYGKVLANVAQFITHRPPTRLLTALQTNSDSLLRLTTDFRFQLPNYQVYSFYEQRPMKGLSSLIVEKNSALLEVNHEEQIPVDADHSAMCKFETNGNDTFEKVYKRVRRIKQSLRRVGDEQSGMSRIRKLEGQSAAQQLFGDHRLDQLSSVNVNTSEHHSSPAKAPSRAEDFQVGWICAVQTEYVVACELLDEEYSTLPASSIYDNNAYTFGRMSQHNVVIACLPKGKYGLTSAASVAKDMLRSFSSIRFGLMVGIAGGAPSKKHDIRLGDVVVSSPIGRTGGVIHYEFGKTIQNQRLERTGALDAPPMVLLTALNVIGARHERRGHRIAETVQRMVEQNLRLRKKYGHPEVGMDQLYESTFVHPDREQLCEDVCKKETGRLVQRHDRAADEDDPVIHYGLIASADRLMKDALTRDTLAHEEGVLCFEMEAAGLMDHFPCVVIRGICDYSDTHKNDLWQGYAAATAAAYAKELLEVIQPTEVGCL